MPNEGTTANIARALDKRHIPIREREIKAAKDLHSPSLKTLSFSLGRVSNLTLPKCQPGV